MDQPSLFDNMTVTEDGDLACGCRGFEHDAGCRIDGLKKPAPCPYSMRFPHKQMRRSSAIRRLFDRHQIDEARAEELLKPISKMNEGCWAKPFNPKGVIEIWRSVRPALQPQT